MESIEELQVMADANFNHYVFGDTEFDVPVRYINLSPRGTGAQGMVWWVDLPDIPGEIFHNIVGLDN